jgi:phosphoesterase RecJ-like protein
VNLLSLLDDHPMWAFFIEQEDGVIRVELRSDGEYDVQKVAVQFGGGGHVPASGCRLTSFDQIPDVLRVMNASVKIA